MDILFQLEQITREFETLLKTRKRNLLSEKYTYKLTALKETHLAHTVRQARALIDMFKLEHDQPPTHTAKHTKKGLPVMK